MIQVAHKVSMTQEIPIKITWRMTMPTINIPEEVIGKIIWEQAKTCKKWGQEIREAISKIDKI